MQNACILLIFFSRCLGKIQVVQPYNSTDTATIRKNYRLILSESLDFQMVDNFSISVYAFSLRIITSLSVDAIFLPRCMKCSTNFWDLSFNVELSSFCLKHKFYFIWVHVEANAPCGLFPSIQQTLCLFKCICDKRLIICVFCIRDCFWVIAFVSCLFSVRPFFH